MTNVKQTKEQKFFSVILAVVVVVTMILPFGSMNTYAASKTKTPKAPTKASISVADRNMTLNWNKGKNAKSYQVALRTSSKGWKYVKKVKKSKANKKKFTKKMKYKVKKSGKKYKVYRYQTIYKYKTLKKSTKSRSYTYKAPKKNTVYTLAVRSLNGKKKSGWKTAANKTWDKNTVFLDGKKHTHHWKAETEEKMVDGTKEVKVVTCKTCGEDLTNMTDAEKKEKHGITWYCSICGEDVASHNKEDIEKHIQEKHTSDVSSQSLAEENISDANNDESEAAASPIEIDSVRSTETTKEVPTQTPTTVTKDYVCNCYAVKDLNGNIHEHKHTWKTRQKEVQKYKTETVENEYWHCKNCDKMILTGTIIAEEVIVAPGASKAITEHKDFEMETNGGYSSNIVYKTETKKTPYTVTVTEKYCDVCGKTVTVK